MSVIEKIAKVYELLQDEKSRIIYDNRVNWLITGDYSYIEEVVKISHPDFPIWNQKSELECIDLIPDDCKVILYGAGSFAKRVIPCLKGRDVIFCDKNYRKYENGYEGYTVINPDRIEEYDDKRIIICTTKYYREVYDYLVSLGVEEKYIIDIRSYFKCGTGDEYFYEDFLKYEEHEIFVDAGSFDLGTSIDLVKCADVEKIYAFEPDKSNYLRCVNNKENNKDILPDIALFNSGTWSEKTQLIFDASADGCSHIGEGLAVIDTDVIDDIIDEDEKVTFIKMDVEGAELESLKGAAEHIRRFKPKLAICIYHKPEDIWEIPCYIKELVPEYKLYLRSYSNADNEMVLYAIC